MATHKRVVQVLLLEEKMLYAKSQKYTTNNIGDVEAVEVRHPAAESCVHPLRGVGELILGFCHGVHLPTLLPQVVRRDAVGGDRHCLEALVLPGRKLLHLHLLVDVIMVEGPRLHVIDAGAEAACRLVLLL